MRPPRVRLGRLVFDPTSGEIERGGTIVRLPPQPARVLALLAARPGVILTREDLRQAIWGEDTFVDFEQGLNFCVRRIRAALADDAKQPTILETLPRRGYRLIAPVEPVADPESAVPAPVAPARTSWLHVLSPRRPAARLLAATIALVGAGLAFVTPRRANVASGRPPRSVTLAVLPFASEGAAREDVSGGLTDEIAGELRRLAPSRLTVVGRTSSALYAGTVKPVEQVGRELGVDYVLTGTVTRSGSRVRVDCRLAGTRGPERAWTQTYARDARGMVTLAADLARGVAAEMEVAAPAETAGGRSVDPEAHELYLRGRSQLDRRTEDGLRKGFDLFRRAIEVSPSYAPAHAGLADAYLLLGAGSYGLARPDEAMPKAKAAAARALEADETLASAHATLALVAYVYDWDWPAAERGFRRAIALDPGYAPAHQWYSLYLRSMGRKQEAIGESDRALALDPLSLVIETDRAWNLFNLREYDRAIEQYRKVLSVDPVFVVARWQLGVALVTAGRCDEGIPELERAVELSGRAPVYLAALGYGLARAHRDGEARAVLHELETLRAARYVSSADVARVHVALSDRDEAFRWLERAYSERSDLFVSLMVDPRLDTLRADPRFADLRRRVGFPVSQP